jgi:hypothetical protein
MRLSEPKITKGDIRMKKGNKILSRLSVFAMALLLFAACGRTPSQKRINKKHAKYVSEMPDAKLVKGQHSKNAEKMAGLIAWEMAADIDSLINGMTTPEKKYGLDKMYCNTAVTTAMRDALRKSNFKEIYGIDLFENARITDMQRGSSFIKYLQKNKEAYDAAAKCINFADITAEDYQDMTKGSIIFYRGNYIDTQTGKTKGAYSHTQMVGGKGFSDDVKGKEADGRNPGGTKFAPSDKGETVTINAYGNLYRYGSDNIAVYNDRPDVVLNEALVIDFEKYLETIMLQQSK